MSEDKFVDLFLPCQLILKYIRLSKKFSTINKIEKTPIIEMSLMVQTFIIVMN